MEPSKQAQCTHVEKIMRFCQTFGCLEPIELWYLTRDMVIRVFKMLRMSRMFKASTWDLLISNTCNISHMQFWETRSRYSLPEIISNGFIAVTGRPCCGLSRHLSKIEGGYIIFKLWEWRIRRHLIWRASWNEVIFGWEWNDVWLKDYLIVKEGTS